MGRGSDPVQINTGSEHLATNHLGTSEDRPHGAEGLHLNIGRHSERQTEIHEGLKLLLRIFENFAGNSEETRLKSFSLIVRMVIRDPAACWSPTIQDDFARGLHWGPVHSTCLSAAS